MVLCSSVGVVPAGPGKGDYSDSPKVYLRCKKRPELDFAPRGEQRGKECGKGLSPRKGEETRFASEVPLFRSPELMGDNGC